MKIQNRSVEIISGGIFYEYACLRKAGTDTTEIKIDPVKNTLIRDGVPSI